MVNVNHWIGGAPAVATKDEVKFPLNVQPGTVITVGVGGQYISHTALSASDHDAAVAVAAAWNNSPAAQISKSYAIVSDTGVEFTAKEAGAAYGPITGSVSGVAVGPSNEQQLIVLPPEKYFGTFQLVFSGSTTASLTFSATAGQVQAALEAIPSIGAGNVTVSATAGGALLVGFQGGLAAKNLPMMTIVSFMRGLSPVIATEVEKGGYGVDHVLEMTVGSTIDGGQYAFEFEGKRSGYIPWNSPAATVQATLEGISTIGTGNIQVSDGATGGKFVITFTGTLGHQLPPTLIADTDLDEVPGIDIYQISEGRDNATEKDRITVNTAGVVAGTWWIDFNGESTVGMNVNAAASDVKAALVGLASIGASDVDVTDAGTRDYVITFSDTGGWANTVMPALIPRAAWSIDDVLLATQSQIGMAGTNELQHIWVSGYNSGTFTISHGGGTTSAITWNATAATVKAALGALSSIGGAANVDITSPTVGQWYVGFQNGRSSRPMDLIAINSGGLLWAVPASVDDKQDGTADAHPQFHAGVGNNPTGGTWKISTNYGDTPPIPYTSTSGEIVSALESVFGSGNVTFNESLFFYEINLGIYVTAQAVDIDLQGGYPAPEPYIANLVNGHPPQNELRSLKLGTCDGGTYSLTFNGYTTAALPHSAGNSAIESALQGITSIGAGNVGVYTLYGSSERVIEFCGSKAAQDITQPITVNNHLTYSGAGSRASTRRIKEGKLGDDCIQKLAYQTLPAGGTYSLTFMGQTTTGIAYSAEDSAVQSAIEALPTIGVGNVSVTGSMSGGWYCRFTGDKASTPLQTFAVHDETIVCSQPAPTVQQLIRGQNGQPETQSVRLADGVTSGTWTLGFNGHTTVPLAYSASASTVTAALESLPDIEGGNVSVSGGPANVDRMIVTWIGTESGKPQELLTWESHLRRKGNIQFSTLTMGANGIPPIQSVTMPTQASGGYWQLAWKPAGAMLIEQTSWIPYGASADDVKAAIEDFDSIGPGEVDVTSTTGGQYIVTWQGPRYGTTAVPLLKAAGQLTRSVDVLVDSNYVKPKAGKACVQKLTIRYCTGGRVQIVRYNSASADAHAVDVLNPVMQSEHISAYETVEIPFDIGQLTELLKRRLGLFGIEVDISIEAKEIPGGGEWTISFNRPMIKSWRFASFNTGDGVYTDLIFADYGLGHAIYENTGREYGADFYALTIPVIGFAPYSTRTYSDSDEYQFWVVQGNDKSILMNRMEKKVWKKQDGHKDRNHIQSVIVQDVVDCVYRLQFDGQETAAIALSATADEVKTKLEALSTIGTGRVAVRPYTHLVPQVEYPGLFDRVPDPGKFYIEFIGDKSLQNQPEITGSFVTAKPKGVDIEVGPAKGPMGTNPTYSVYDLKINLQVNAPVYLSLWWPQHTMRIDGSTTAAQIKWELQKVREAGHAPANSADLEIFDMPSVTETREVWVNPNYETRTIGFKVFRFQFTGANWGNPYDLPAFESMFKPRCGDPAFQYHYERVETGRDGTNAMAGVKFGYRTSDAETQFSDYSLLYLTEGGDPRIMSLGDLENRYFVRLIPTSGTWTLTFARTDQDGNPQPGTGDTAVLNWNSTSTEVQAALESLPSIGVGNVTVVGDPQISPMELDQAMNNPWIINTPGEKEKRYPAFTITFVNQLGMRQIPGRALLAQSYMPRPGISPKITVNDFQLAGAAQNTIISLTYTGYVSSADVEIWGDGNVKYHSPSVHLTNLMMDLTNTSEQAVAEREAYAKKNCEALESAVGWWYGPGSVDVTFEYTNDAMRTFHFEFKGSRLHESVNEFRAFGPQQGPTPELDHAYMQSYRRGQPDLQRVQLPYAFKELGTAARNHIFHIEFTLTDDAVSSDDDETTIGYVNLFGLEKAALYIPKAWRASDINDWKVGVANQYSKFLTNGFVPTQQGHTPITIPDSGTSYMALKNIKFHDSQPDNERSPDRVRAFDVEMMSEFSAMPFLFESVFTAADAPGGFSRRVAQWARPAGAGEVATGTWTLTYKGETTCVLPMPVDSFGQVGAAIRALQSINQNAVFCQEAKNAMVFFDPGEGIGSYGILNTLGELIPTTYGWAKEYVIRFIGADEFKDNPPFTVNAYAVDGRLKPAVDELQVGRSRSSAVQLLTCQQGRLATDGTWTLTHGGSSAALNWNCTASEASVALDAVFGPSKLVPTGGPFPTSPLTITFDGYDEQDLITTSSQIVYPIGGAADANIVGSDITTTEISGLASQSGGLLIKLPRNANKGIWGFEMLGKQVTFPWNAETEEIQSAIYKVFGVYEVSNTTGNYLSISDIFWPMVTASNTIYKKTGILGDNTTETEAVHNYKLQANGTYLTEIRAGRIRFFSNFDQRYTAGTGSVTVARTTIITDFIRIFLKMSEGVYAGTWGFDLMGKRFVYPYNVAAQKVCYDLQQAFPPIMDGINVTGFVCVGGREFPQSWLVIEARGAYKTELAKPNTFSLFYNLTADAGVDELTSQHCDVRLIRDGSPGTQFDVSRTREGAGPNYWGSDKNWSLGHKPVNGELVVMGNCSVAMLAGFPTDGTLDLAGFRIEADYAAAFGPDDPTQPAPCFKAKAVTIDASSSPYVRLNLAAGDGTDRLAVVQNTSDPAATDQVVNISGGDSHTDLIVRKGSVGVAVYAGETHTFRSIVSTHDGNPADDVSLKIGSGGTVPLLYQSGGHVESWAAVAIWKQAAGEAFARGGSVGKIESIGGTFYYEIGTSTLEELRYTELAGLVDGIVDFSRNSGAVTVTAAVIPTGAEVSKIVFDPMHRVTLPS
jgi:hypothetical protein